MITEIEDYFTKGCGRCKRFDTPDCSMRRWTQGQCDLRARVLPQAGNDHDAAGVRHRRRDFESRLAEVRDRGI